MFLLILKCVIIIFVNLTYYYYSSYGGEEDLFCLDSLRLRRNVEKVCLQLLTDCRRDW